MSDRTGILADTVTVSCIGCDCVLIVPARLSGEALCFDCIADRREVEARKEAARVTGERTNRGRRDRQEG